MVAAADEKSVRHNPVISGEAVRRLAAKIIDDMLARGSYGLPRKYRGRMIVAKLRFFLM
jgi:hypothetical protein